MQRRKIRTKRLELSAALVAALSLAGCGGGAADRPTPVRPKLPAGLATQLAEQSDRVAAALAAGDSCRALGEATALQQSTLKALNAQQVPAALQEDLSGTVNDLVVRIRCVPVQHDEDEHEERGNGAGKHKGNDKKGKND